MAGHPYSHSPGFERAGSGIDANGRWTPEFEGQRPPFEAGNGLAVTHGAYASPLRLGERPAEIADAIRPWLVGWHPGMEATLSSYTIVLTRIERASSALDAIEEGLDIADSYRRREDDQFAYLRRDLRSWITTASRLADQLGLTPSAAARIARDVGVGALAAAEHADLISRYGAK